MKTRILSAIAIMFVVLASTKTTTANTIKDDAFTVLNDISAINKIQVYGNVELYVSDATTDRVKVYNKYYAESALVQSKNGVLSIANYTNEKLVVWVSAADLRSISAFDNATVNSFGKLSKIEFNVDLHNNATANLNLDAYHASVTVKNNATINLKGTADELNLNRDMPSNVKSSEFAVTHITENKPAFTAGVNTKVIGM